MIGLVLAMVWARRGQAVTLALLALFGVAAAVAAPAYLRTADRAVAAGQIRTALPEDLTVSVVARQVDRRSLEPGAEPPGPDLERDGSVLLDLPGFDHIHSVEYRTVGLEPVEGVSTRVVHRQRVCDHLVMTAGRCLAGESDIVLGEKTGRRLGVAPGEPIELSFALYKEMPPRYVPEGAPKRLVIAGFYRVPEPRDAFWGDNGYFRPGTERGLDEVAFISGATMAAMDHGQVEATLDAYAGPGALAVDRLPAVRDGIDDLRAEVARAGGAVDLRGRLPATLTRIDAGQAAAHQIVPVLAIALVLLACLTIYLAVLYSTEGRRPELAVVALRGARWGQRWALATGENVLAILAGSLAGCVAGQVLVDALAAWRFPDVGSDFGLGSLRWAPVAAGAAVLTALFAERRQVSAPVAELLRRAPRVPGIARAVAAELVVVALAAVAVLQLSGQLRGVGTAAAALVLVAGAQVAARLLVPLAAIGSRQALRRGRLGVALAGFQLSRRPGAIRLFALVTAAVAVTGYAAAAIDVAARGRATEAFTGTGAARVLHLAPTSRQNLLAAVRAVDPSGSFALAAVRLPGVDGGPVAVAVDTTRLGAVAEWPREGPAPSAVREALRPDAPPPPAFDGVRISAEVTATFEPGKYVTLTAILSPRNGGEDQRVEFGELRPGRHQYQRPVPACARGCTLNTLRITGGQGTIDAGGTIAVHRLTGAGVLATPERWRASEGGTIGTAGDGLLIKVASLAETTDGLLVQPVTTPYPLPVATAGIAALRGFEGLDHRNVPVVVRLPVPVVPGAGSPAILADLDYADRLAADGLPSTEPMVWLNAHAPADLGDQLAAHGVTVVGETRADQVRRSLDEQGPAIAMVFYGMVAGLATVLAAGTLVLAATVDRNRRVEDLSALRNQGLTRAAVRQATLWTYPALVAVAATAGIGVALGGWWLTGWALPLAGLEPSSLSTAQAPRLPVVVATSLGSAALLAVVAGLAGHRTLRRTGPGPSRPRRPA
ncbi:ABC transporter permease [Actinoplanes sp. TRM 88003]|uniref:ABC transporter permease n=1 Tax=Paractinoplanes aksuensis TaxID=2939490 RepID=A0ABT1DTC7_9ACTN|nr:FtsX-like permease family protein [Actinoplanes aksuensis]MCO8274088.1 ABC transporter permease [Actinoplanes aksuensis]